MTYLNNKKLFLPYDVDPNINKYKRKIIGGGQSCFIIGSQELSKSVNFRHIDNFNLNFDENQIIPRNRRRMFNQEVFEKVEMNNERIFKEIEKCKELQNEGKQKRRSYSSQNNDSWKMKALITYEYAS